MNEWRTYLYEYSLFRLGECLSHRAEYAAARQQYEQLHMRFPRSYFRLLAFSGIADTFFRENQKVKADVVLRQLRGALDEIDFSKAPPTLSRQNWEEYLKKMEQDLRK